MGTDQQDIADWVMNATRGQYFTKEHDFNEGKLITKACNALGWNSVPQQGGLTVEWDGDFMNTATGSVDSYSNWRSDSATWEGDVQAQLDSLVEVVKDTDGNWIRKNTMNKMTFEQKVEWAIEFFGDEDDGFNPEQNHLSRNHFACCQSCGWAAIDKIELEEDEYMDNVVFYHDQDTENLREDGWFYISWRGDGDKIKSFFEDCWLNVEWNGDDTQRMKITNKTT